MYVKRSRFYVQTFQDNLIAANSYSNLVRMSLELTRIFDFSFFAYLLSFSGANNKVWSESESMPKMIAKSRKMSRRFRHTGIFDRPSLCLAVVHTITSVAIRRN